MHHVHLRPEMIASVFNRLCLTAVLLVVFASSVFAQSGRIEGTVIEAETGEPLIGVNIIIEELTIGAPTNADGYFSIINVRPGTYTVRASMIGFTTVILNDVRININQTTTLDFQMREEVFSGEEVVVVAERPIVERDVGASRVNIGAEEIRNLPVTSVTGIVGLQAGIQGTSIRGGLSDEALYTLNGISLRDERNNSPFTAVSITSISEIQVQSGGFSAEYGDVQSGIVNVVTKEGSRDRYNFDIYYQHNPPSKKHFGPLVNDPNSYWIRPFLDPQVAFTGTGAWDPWTQRQYPTFQGWIAVAEGTLNDADPNRHLTPEAAQQVFLWQHRKDMAITDPDYTLDFGFGGPIPIISERLGNLRFWASHRQNQSMYVIPLSRDRYSSYTSNIKVTSDLGLGMKLSIDAMMGAETGTNSNNVGAPGIFSSASGIANNVRNRNSFGNSRIFASDYWAPTRVEYRLLGAKFTKTINNNSYFEVLGSFFSSDYSTNPGRLRDLTPVRTFGNGYTVDEAPFGFYPQPSSGIGSGLRMGVGMSNSRDSSSVANVNVRFDYVNQYNRYNQLKTGLQLVQTYSDVNYASVDEFLPSGRSQSIWDNKPIRGAVYAQNKFEYEGIVAEVGLRLDYSDANTTWIIYDEFDPRFGQALEGDLSEYFDTEKTKPNWTISPRIAVSFPITVMSKLYFNYGHFRSMPTPDNLYRVERFLEDQSISRIANPNLPLPKTVSYELGYEQALSRIFLIRLAGYYKDESNLNRRLSGVAVGTALVGSGGSTLYNVTTSDGYRDTRGFEITLRKAGGKYVQGFINYTYMVRSDGRFGFATQYANSKDQREYERLNSANPQAKPLAQPYARLNLDFFTPVDLGPEVLGMSLLGDWRATFLATWQAGYYVTWTGGGSIPGINNNVRWKDSYNLNLRLSRTFRAMDSSINFFADFNNVLNTRYLTQNGFVDGDDYNDYMKSLHLPANKLEPLRGSYLSVPGSDRPGTYRQSSVQFQPIVAVNNIASVANPHERPLYYNYADENYYQYRNGSFVLADKSFVDKVLKDKAYIDMPNLTSFAFFNPRNVVFGVRITF